MQLSFVIGHGNSISPKLYEFVDESVMYGKHYYRLRQIDNDGSFEYSDVIDVAVPTLKIILFWKKIIQTRLIRRPEYAL
jgi:hypothetical protein